MDIGAEVFHNCIGLQAVYLSDLGAWCNISFEDASANPIVYANKLYIDGEVITDLVIPDSVTSISADTFRNCGSLTSVMIPNSVADIGNNAFINCKNLALVVIGNGVTSIGDGSFRGCSGLLSVVIGEMVASIGEGAFFDCANLTKITWNTSATLYLTNESNIFSNAGTDGDGISVIFGDSVLNVPDFLFFVSSVSSSPKIAEVIIGNNVTRIGNYAFSNCDDLTTLVLSDNVSSIGSYAFLNCSSLTTVTIPRSLNIIGGAAFLGCAGLTSVTFDGTVDEWNGISKGYRWNYNCPFTEVVCLDGVVQV